MFIASASTNRASTTVGVDVGKTGDGRVLTNTRLIFKLRVGAVRRDHEVYSRDDSAGEGIRTNSPSAAWTRVANDTAMKSLVTVDAVKYQDDSRLVVPHDQRLVAM